MSTKTVKPYVTISLIDVCNMKCVYCPPMGENYRTSKNLFSVENVKGVVKTAVSMNIPKIRFTGGEPLLYPHLQEVTEYAAANGLIVHINSNGLLLTKHLHWMQYVKNLVVKVSLDAATPKALYEMSGVNRLDRILDGVRQGAALGIVKRINFVLTSMNADQIPGVLALCKEVGIGLKIFDMYPVPETDTHWNMVYMPPDALPLEGRATAPYGYTNRYGTPTRELLVDGVPVRIKNCFDGTRYHDMCKTCPAYPCPEGLYCMVVTPSLTVVPCRLGTHLHRPCNTFSDLQDALNDIVELYDESYYVNGFGDKYRVFYDEALTRSNDTTRQLLIDTVVTVSGAERAGHVVGC